MKSPKNFQSYLFIGSTKIERFKNIDSLLLSLGTNRNSNSPDLTIIEPVKNSIGISQIRELKKYAYQKPTSENYNTVIVGSADTLTIEAQNSLLKLIEEPPEKTIIILEGENKASFLPTILSRVVVQKTNELEDSKVVNNPSQNISNLDLEEILDVVEPKVWINNQIKTRYYFLISNLEDSKKQVTSIENLANTKKMMRANVNPKFLLASLVFGQNK